MLPTNATTHATISIYKQISEIYLKDTWEMVYCNCVQGLKILCLYVFKISACTCCICYLHTMLPTNATRTSKAKQPNTCIYTFREEMFEEGYIRNHSRLRVDCFLLNCSLMLYFYVWVIKNIVVFL